MADRMLILNLYDKTPLHTICVYIHSSLTSCNAIIPIHSARTKKLAKNYLWHLNMFLVIAGKLRLDWMVYTYIMYNAKLEIESQQTVRPLSTSWSTDVSLATQVTLRRKFSATIPNRNFVFRKKHKKNNKKKTIRLRVIFTSSAVIF